MISNFTKNNDKFNNEINKNTFFNKASDILKNFNKEKHLKARPPKNAYLYFPPQNEICEIITKNNKIFVNRKFYEGNIKYTEYELEIFQNFMEFCKTFKKDNFEFKNIFSFLDDSTNADKKKNSINYDETNKSKFNSVNLSQSDVYRFLISFDFDFERTILSLVNYYNFQLKTYPIDLRIKLKKILLSGFIYIHGRDNRFRPIIILSPNAFLNESKKNKDFTYEDWMLSVIYLLDYCINFLLIPAQVESWNIICDMKDVALYSVPNDLKNLLNLIQQNYKNRLNSMYVINLGTFAGILWNVIKGLMGENIQKKIIMINSKNNYFDLFENINRTQLEKKYGGFAENIELNYEDYFKYQDNNSNSNYINYNLNTNCNTSNININSNHDFSSSARDSYEHENNFYLLNKFHFPPNMPSDEYFTDIDIKIIDKILIGEEEYKNKVIKEKVLIRSPFYRYDLISNINENDMNIKISDQNINKVLLEKNGSNSYYNKDEEEFFSARDYINSESSSILNSSIYSQIQKFRKEKELINKDEKNLDFNSINNIQVNDNFESIDKVGKNLEENEKTISKNEINLCQHNVINKSNKSEKNSSKQNKVIILKKKKDTKEINKKNKNSPYQENIQIDNDDQSQKCKISCGKMKVECIIF